jgi:hypothetical protein
MQMLILWLLAAVGVVQSEEQLPYSCDSASADDAEATLSGWLGDSLDVDSLAADFFSGRAVASDDADFDCGAYAKFDAPAVRVSIFEAPAKLRSDATRSQVFISRNGDSDGFLVPYERRCLTSLTERGAYWLNGDEFDLDWPKQLRSASNLPVVSDDDVWAVAHGILYIMMDQEVWVWPHFKQNFEWAVGRGRFRLRSLSDSPRVLYVKDMLSADECSELIEVARPSLVASPTKDYSDDAAFKNFRTSQTAHVGDLGAGDAVRRRSWFITRVPVIECVEATQVVRYGTEKAWFKPHMDVYHNWPGFPDERSGGEAGFEAWVADFEARQLAGEFGDNVQALVHLGLLPSVSDAFQHAVVALAIQSGDDLMLDKDWMEWLRSNLANRATGLLQALLKAKPELWARLLDLWLDACRRHSGQVSLPFAARERDERTPRRKRVQPNRHVTLFQYLNEVESGGETVFPQGTAPADEPPRPPRPDMPECERGLAVRPKAGDSAVFYHRFGNMRIDHSAMHGGCPPISGEKWGANAFIWNIDNRIGYRLWNGMI